VYLTDGGKVREMRAWLIDSAGQVKRYGKDRAVDLAIVDNDIYNEARVRVLRLSDEAEAGTIFGYEATVEERSVFTQFERIFQDRLPTLVSRYSFTVPPGWRAESVTFNHAKLEPTVAGTTYTWELRDLPFIEEEPASPEVTNLVPRLAVSLFPAPNARANLGRSFGNWAEVSRWLTELSAGQAELDDPLAVKARALTADAKTEFERIREIGRFVQGINYISVQTGIGRGGGYRPHAATEVFAKSYGDCKDKANLMRAMLKALRIESYLVSIYAGDPTYVRDEWASPQQFNHCIIAIRVSDETQSPIVVNHPRLGRLLIFDPTDESTPVGDLPAHEQGSLALVVAGEDGALLRMPITPPEANMIERRVEVSLAADGSIKGNVREQLAGQAAVSARREFRGQPRPEYARMIERWITRGASTAVVSRVEPADSMRDGRFSLQVDFDAARYGQLMQSRLLVFRPAIVSRRDSLFLTERARKHAVVLDSHAYAETTQVNLPPDFDVDELPDPLKLETPFGKYAASYEVKGNQLLFTRRLVVPSVTVPAEQYAAVRNFFERIRAAEQAPVVLAKK
jgi:transglutaminase-like putative cysteine protease